MVKNLLIAALFAATSINATSATETDKGRLARVAASVKQFIAPNGSPKRVLGATVITSAVAATYCFRDKIRNTTAYKSLEQTKAYKWIAKHTKCPYLAPQKATAAKPVVVLPAAPTPAKSATSVNPPFVTTNLAIAARAAQASSVVVVPTAGTIVSAPAATPKAATPAAKPVETSFWSRIFGS